MVKAISVAPLSDTITLERTGEGDGESVNEIKKPPLVKDKKTYTVEVFAEKATWSGYTTFRRGVILSDSLSVESPVIVSSRELGQASQFN